MSHLDTYRNNEAYAQFLASRDPAFYSKYAEALKPRNRADRILDVGCGVGQAVEILTAAGFEAWGVDVSAPCIQRAAKISPRCLLYDGRSLPFPDCHFGSVGALNVLEHIEDPESFVREMVRVVEPGGRVVLSSPNFFRVIGFYDYHPMMRGVRNKWRNWRRLREKRAQLKTGSLPVRLDPIQPILSSSFTSDDDAIRATNPVEMVILLKRCGCQVKSVSCTDRFVPPIIDLLLNLTPLRYLVFNAFIVAHRTTAIP